MDITSLEILKRQREIIFKPDGLLLTVCSSWIIEGENRLSYTTLIRLIECCREYHWDKDVLSKIRKSNIDSITKSIKGEFIKPIVAGSKIYIQYKVVEVRPRGYRIIFAVKNDKNRSIRATFELILVFYDPQKEKPMDLPQEDQKLLKKLI